MGFVTRPCPHERLLNRKINSFPIVHKYQLEKKARGNPLRILNLPSSIATIPCESTAHPKSSIRT